MGETGGTERRLGRVEGCREYNNEHGFVRQVPSVSLSACVIRLAVSIALSQSDTEVGLFLIDT